MSRAARITVGSVIAGALVFVAIVAGVMSGTTAISRALDPFGSDSWLTAGVDTPASAEVIDVDDDGYGWVTLDVRWTTADGEVIVTYIDWAHRDDVPAIGDQVDILYDDLDPEWAFAADDPFVSGATEADAGDAEAEAEAAAAERAPVERAAGWVTLGALLALVVTVVVTVVAAVRAPSPGRESRDGTVGLDPLGPLPWQGGPPPPGYAPPYPPPPYPQAYPQAPYARPYPSPPSAPPPYPLSPYAPSYPPATQPQQVPSSPGRSQVGAERAPGEPPEWQYPS